MTLGSKWLHFSACEICLKESNSKASLEPIINRYLGQVCHLSTTFRQWNDHRAVLPPAEWEQGWVRSLGRWPDIKDVGMLPFSVIQWKGLAETWLSSTEESRRKLGEQATLQTTSWKPNHRLLKCTFKHWKTQLLGAQDHKNCIPSWDRNYGHTYALCSLALKSPLPSPPIHPFCQKGHNRNHVSF